MYASQETFTYPEDPWGGLLDLISPHSRWGGPSMRSVMQANGDGAKKIWGTEFGAPTNGPNGVSEQAQAQAITKAYALWKTYDWAGPLFTYQMRDYGTDPSNRENFFGLLRHNFSQKPAYGAYRAAAEGAGAGATDHAASSSPGQENLSRLDGDHQRRPWTTDTTTTAPQISKSPRRSRAGGTPKTTLRATVNGAAGGIGLIEVQVRRDREWATYRIARDEVDSSGTFAVRLALNPGERYRARAGYLGSKDASASASRYVRFTL